MRRAALGCLLILALSLGQSWPAVCQNLQTNWRVDWSARFEYLFGTQTIREASSPLWLSKERANEPLSNSWPDRVRVDYNPRLWVFSGLGEASPLPRVFARFSGSVSIPSQPRDHARFMYPFLKDYSLGGTWPIRSDFASLEASGGYHLLYDGLYRLTLGAGYRQEWWRHSGSIGNDSIDERVNTGLPFLTLRAALFLPGWISSLELLGSTFIQKVLWCDASQAGKSASYTYRGRDGGRLEIRVSGTGAVTRSLFWGISAKYVFEGMYGPLQGTISGSGTGQYDAYVEESMGLVGLVLTWVM